eukprot:2429110-Pleurochrysis_carterae.AAC.2
MPSSSKNLVTSQCCSPKPGGPKDGGPPTVPTQRERQGESKRPGAAPRARTRKEGRPREASIQLGTAKARSGTKHLADASQS